MKYEDLLSVPYKELGRDINGMDCYGLVLEMCRRADTPLVDFVYSDAHISEAHLNSCASKINVRQVDSFQGGDIIQCTYNGNLHIGYLLDKSTVIHATYSGVRVTPIFAFSNRKFFRVVPLCR